MGTQLLDQQIENSPLYEIFMADGSIVEDDNGLIWKDVLREGEWAFRPGQGGKPQPIPLKIIEGHANDRTEIGMQDLVDAFEEGAIDHVTVPLSHEDKPHENTGFVRALKIIEREGKKYLRAGIDFTEPDIKGKAVRGTIPNTSVGILFDYIKKDSGKQYGQALGHVALTGKPWINGMKPFGASEDIDEEEITSFTLEGEIWNPDQSFAAIKNQIEAKLGEDYAVVNLSTSNSTALVTNGNGSSTGYIVPFSTTGGQIYPIQQPYWIPAKPQDFSDLDGQLGPSIGAPDRGAKDETHKGGTKMGKPDVKPGENPDPGATSDDPAPDQVVLSEEVRNQLKEELRAEFSEKSSSLIEENEALRKSVQEMKVNERIEQLKQIGFDTYPGLLSTFRNLMLADNQKEVLTLSEEKDSGDVIDVKLSVTDVVERIIDSMPKEDGKLKFAEQAIVLDDHSRPPAEPAKREGTAKERGQAMADDLGIPLPKDGDA